MPSFLPQCPHWKGSKLRCPGWRLCAVPEMHRTADATYCTYLLVIEHWHTSREATAKLWKRIALVNRPFPLSVLAHLAVEDRRTCLVLSSRSSLGQPCPMMDIGAAGPLRAEQTKLLDEAVHLGMKSCHRILLHLEQAWLGCWRSNRQLCSPPACQPLQETHNSPDGIYNSN